MRKRKVLVLGAGPAGLTTALKLAESNLEIEVIESRNCPGGLSGSLSVDGCVFDYGPHAIHIQIPEVVVLVKELLGKELIFEPFKSQIYFLGKYLNHPLRMKDIFLGIDLDTSLASFRDFIFARLKGKFFPSRDVSYEDWVVARFGRKLYDLYFGSYTRKVWGIEPRELSSVFASERIPVSSLWQVLLKIMFGSFLRLKQDAHAHSPYGRLFYYPKRGIGFLSEKMAEGILTKGGKIAFSQKVEKIFLNGSRAAAIKIKDAAGSGRISCDWLASTIPLPELIFLLEPSPPNEILDAASRLNYRAIIFLYLVVNRERVSENHWTYFSDKQILFNRVYEVKNFSPEATPKGKTGLCLEITCDKGDALWEAEEREIYKKAIGCLEETGFLNPSEVLKHFSVKVEHAYPLYRLGYQESLQKVLKFLDTIENLITYGRQGLFTYTNTDHSIDMGMKVAQYILDGEADKAVCSPGELLKKYTLSY